jgi:phenolic acid decarboxylase
MSTGGTEAPQGIEKRTGRFSNPNSGSDAMSPDSLLGKTLRWTITKGAMEGASYEHDLDPDGTVVWRVVEGQGKGMSEREKECAVERITDSVHVLSYRGASGYTLTVTLSFEDGRMVGFASNDKEWYPLEGTFEVVE